MSARVYVAAPFTEYELVREVQAELRRRGATISADWTEGIESLPPGVTDADVSEEVALQAAVADFKGVMRADACIFLTVPDKTRGRGMWVELGFALAWRLTAAYEYAEGMRAIDKSGALQDDRTRRIAVCGPHRDSTIFSRLGKRFADWHDALPYVLGE